MNSTLTVTFHEHGVPADVIRIEEQPLRELAEDDVLVDLLYAPINPADINAIEGTYPSRRQLPCVGGIEGIGRIAAVGKNAAQFPVGAHVLIASNEGTWRRQIVLHASEIIALPALFANRELTSHQLQQLAMLRTNPATAWRMLHDFVPLKSGDWIVQNVANSGVGRAVIEIAKSLGIRTINIVRRPELIDELRAIGADSVLVDNENSAKEIALAANHEPIALALNAVGGESALRLAKSLAPSGTHVTYGAMGRAPVRIPNGLLIFKDLRFRGFWISQWYRTANREARDAMFAKLFDLANRQLLQSPVEKFYPLAEAHTALAHAQQSRRSGKIMFDLQA